MSAREAILNRVRNACGRENTQQPNTATDSVNPDKSLSRADMLKSLPSDVQHRLSQPASLTKPEVSDNLIESLITQMESVQMSVVRLQSSKDVAAAVDWYLHEQKIEGAISVSPSLQHIEWQNEVQFGPASGKEATSVTSAYAAVAETGSIALASGAQTPATLNFLPENHLVVLHESQVVKHMEDVWTQLRQDDALPRAINLVTGPSRTGDIEQTIELGAHGPRRMHVMLIASD